MSRRLEQPADLAALSGCADGVARAFVSLASDIALVIDDAGIVTSVAQNTTAPMSDTAAQWVGRPWAETVTDGTRGKIESLLADAQGGRLVRRREVNHAGQPGADLPVAYTALRLGHRGPVLAVGKDLRSMAAIQQRFLEAQAALERSYWRARHDEVRHRLLYQVATDAVLAVDTQSQAVEALNASALTLLQADGGLVPGKALAPQFDARSRPAVAALLQRALAGSDPVAAQARLSGSHLTLSLVATRLSARLHPHRVVLRLRQTDPQQDDPLAVGSALARHVDGTPEGILITDTHGRLREANLAFVQMAQASGLGEVLGQPLQSWLHEAAQMALVAIQTEGLIAPRQLAMTRRDGSELPLMLGGALLADVTAGEVGFTLRPCTVDVLTADARAAALVKAIDALAAELGRVELPELLQRAQSLARRHLVLTALDQQVADTQAAARILGISAEEVEAMRRPPETRESD